MQMSGLHGMGGKLSRLPPHAAHGGPRAVCARLPSSPCEHMLAPVHASSASIRIRVCHLPTPSSVRLCPWGAPPPTDTIPDNYSVLILLVFAAPGVVFFFPAGNLLVHHSLHFPGGKVFGVPVQRERESCFIDQGWKISETWI